MISSVISRFADSTTLFAVNFYRGKDTDNFSVSFGVEDRWEVPSENHKAVLNDEQMSRVSGLIEGDDDWFNFPSGEKVIDELVVELFFGKLIG